MSRALSVHQGKGATSEEAQVGALLEAVESNAAELFDSFDLECSFDDLPETERPPSIGDFAADRKRPPSRTERVRWVRGLALPGLDPVLLPLPLVSLDFTSGADSLYDRASNGIATAARRDEALLVALHELIERDAVVEWQAHDMAERMADAIAPQTVPFSWFREIERRVAGFGATLSCYRVRSLTGTPVFACEINDPRKRAVPYRSANGRGAHPLPEIALFKAVSEACQARATFIAGARDDLYPWRYSQPDTSIRVAFALPPPPGMDMVDFAAVKPGPDSLWSVSVALAARGFRQGVAVVLSETQGLSSVRVFIPGLGSMTRRRRRERGQE